jgi:hypothetical protein
LRCPPRSPTLFATGVLILLSATVSLPFTSPAGSSMLAWICAYALAIVPVGFVLHGFSGLVGLVGDLTTPRLLALGATAAVLGGLTALLSRPEALSEGARWSALIALFAANVFRVLSAASLGFVLARYVLSPGAALLVAAVAAASDLFSVFAGPTKALVREDSPALDFLVLIFPTFGTPLGFGLGVSDFIFIALFAYVARALDFHYPLTLICCCAATALALTAGLLTERPLPALPFIALSFVLVNAGRLRTALRK